MRLHHVQLAIPRDSEPQCRAFYCDVLGWRELPKPEPLAARGGLWLDTGDAELHLGVEADFRPAKKAHPAFLIDDVETLAVQFTDAGFPVIWDDALAGYKRFYVHDAVGNRLEFMESTGPDPQC